MKKIQPVPGRGRPPCPQNDPLRCGRREAQRRFYASRSFQMAGGVDWDAFLEPMAEAGKSVADLAYTTEDGQSLIHRIEFFSGLHTPERAEDIGLGAGTIDLATVD